MKENKIWTVLSMLEWATGYFEKKGVPNPRLSIEWLLADLLQIKRLELYLQYDRPLSSGELNRLRPMVKRRSDHEPLQYITGSTDFLDCRIEVGPEVLIPRSETEQLVELLLNREKTRYNQPLKLLDIGTGSGCIPISISKKLDEWNCYGMDISIEALQLAKKNAEQNRVTVHFYESDIFDSGTFGTIGEQNFDLITSNPPYIPPDEVDTLDREVREFEPDSALYLEKPLTIYTAISDFAVQYLKESGTLYLECNNRFTSEIAEMLESQFSNVETAVDYDKRERFIIAEDPLTS